MYEALLKDLQEGVLKKKYENLEPYPQSLTIENDYAVFMARVEGERKLIAVGKSPVYLALDGVKHGEVKVAPLTHENRLVLNRYFPFTEPVPNISKKNSIGLGDRLGEATPGHIAALGDREVFPVFAQQSVRELKFTGRTYDDVVDAAAFAVFQEGYRKGYGADGDHLKNMEDIVDTLAMGATMITLDSSEKIDNSIGSLTPEALTERYLALPLRTRTEYEDKYLGKKIVLEEFTLEITQEILMRDVLIYGKAIDFITEVYEKIIRDYPRPVDFEVSIDETETPTEISAHYLIASELKERKVVLQTMAPRFIGEFQKGIDYMGDLDLFEVNLKQHIRISEHFGYRLSIHSGSDKFSIFPILARNIRDTFHVKTAGTNWLEFLRVLSEEEPKLYRMVRAFALEMFEPASAFYHVTTDLAAIRPVEELRDSEFPLELEDSNVRQLLHITYGYMLRDQDGNGQKTFRKEFEKALVQYEDEYKEHLRAHIGKHLDLLSF